VKRKSSVCKDINKCGEKKASSSLYVGKLVQVSSIKECCMYIAIYRPQSLLKTGMDGKIPA